MNQKTALSVTTENKSKREGEVNPDFTITYSGFKYEDSILDFETAPSE